MKLSTNSRYGLRALVDLAANYQGEPLALAGIAARQHISESYLETAFAMLRKAGYIRSAKGSLGGYAPAVNPREITVWAVLRTLEGDLSIVEDTAAINSADPIKRCIKQTVWDAVNEGLERTLGAVTVAELAGEYNRMRGNALDYQI